MALPDKLIHTQPTTRTSGISSASVAAGANYLGSAIDNTTDRHTHAIAEVSATFTTAPTTGTWSLTFVRSLDGTNYEAGAGNGTGSGDVDPLRNQVDALAPTANFRVVREAIPIGPGYFKPLIVSSLNQTGVFTVRVDTYCDAGEIAD